MRNTGIDFLHGLSIILVVIHHIYIRLPLDQGWFKDALLLVSFHQKNGFQLNSAEKYLKWVCHFGKNSYEIYLTHMFVVLFATSVFLSSEMPLNRIALWYMGILVLSLGLGSLVSKYYSEPMNAFLRKGLSIKSDRVSDIVFRQNCIEER